MMAPFEFDSILRIPCSNCTEYFEDKKHHDGRTATPARLDLAYPSYAAEKARNKGWLITVNRSICPKCRKVLE